MENIQPQYRDLRRPLRYLHIGKRLSVLFLIAFCFLAFMAAREVNNRQSASPVKFINPEDMVQGEMYYFADHGNGMSVVQFAALDNKGNISTTFSITPTQSLFSRAGLWGTVDDAGDIRVATQAEITHLHQCIIADAYVP